MQSNGNFKTPNDINPSFINDIFKLRMTNRLIREKYKLILEIQKSNQVRFGTKSLGYLGSKVWNSLPYHIKSSENLTILKTLIKNWRGGEWGVCSKLVNNPNQVLMLTLLSFYIICIYVDFD